MSCFCQLLIVGSQAGLLASALNLYQKKKKSECNFTCIPQRDFVRLTQNNVWVRALYLLKYFSLSNLNMLVYSLNLTVPTSEVLWMSNSAVYFIC